MKQHLHNTVLKYGFIALFLIIIAGCSSVKRTTVSSTKKPSSNESGMVKISDVEELNFTAQPFFIQRAEINIAGNNVIATIKFAKPDSFLISVRTLFGIEAARILLTSDSVFVNDRINRILYLGSSENVKKVYGFDLMFFPVLLGDLITEAQSLSGIDCSGGKAVFSETRKDYVINYYIDCATKKCKEIEIEKEFMKDYISIEFDDFEKNNKIIFPKRLKINNFANFAFFEIEVKKVEFKVDSGMEFIPGRNYTRVEIK